MKKPFILKISIAVVLFLVASVYLLTNYDNSENLTGGVINEENEIGAEIPKMGLRASSSSGSKGKFSKE